MIKKIFVFIFALFIFNMTTVEILASEFETLNATFVSDLNVNKSSKDEIVQFRTTENFKFSTGEIAPRGTIIKGRIQSRKKGRFAFRRAKVRIVLDEMTLPNGTVYKIEGNTKRPVLKGSAVKNTIKGIVMTPVALVVGVAGVCVIALETVTIVGILAVPPTAFGFAVAEGKITKGVNCKKYRGEAIELKLKVNGAI